MNDYFRDEEMKDQEIQTYVNDAATQTEEVEEAGQETLEKMLDLAKHLSIDHHVPIHTSNYVA